MKYIDILLNIVLKLWAYYKEQNLGALEDKEDIRDVPAQTVLTNANFGLPEVYLNEDINKIEVYNQKRLGVCVGTAHTTQMELLYPKKDFSVRFSYRMAKYIDGYKGEGTWGRIMAKVHKDFGIATTETRPEDFNLAHWLYIKFTFTKAEITEAKKYKIKGYVFAKNNDEIKALIKKYGSVSATIEARAMWNARGLHRIIFVGWDKKGFIFRNSWGSGKLLTLPYKEKIMSPIAYIKSDADKKKIDNHLKKVENKYKYFSSKESYKINPDFMKIMDKIRGELGRPIIIKSGFRTKEHNKAIGGAINSRHLYGEALDIKKLDSKFAYDLIKLAYKYDIYGIEVASGHIHLDYRQKKDRAIFYGVSK